MKVRARIDVWLNVDADTEDEAETRVLRIRHHKELNIDWLNSIDSITDFEYE